MVVSNILIVHPYFFGWNNMNPHLSGVCLRRMDSFNGWKKLKTPTFLKHNHHLQPVRGGFFPGLGSPNPKKTCTVKNHHRMVGWWWRRFRIIVGGGDDPPKLIYIYTYKWKLCVLFLGVLYLTVFSCGGHLEGTWTLPEWIFWVTLFWHFRCKRNKPLAGDSAYTYMYVYVIHIRSFLPQTPGGFFPGSTLSMLPRMCPWWSLFSLFASWWDLIRWQVNWN